MTDLVLFDLDNTLIDGDSDHAWGQFLVERGLVDGPAHLAASDRFYADYCQGQLDIDAFLRFQLAPLARLPRQELEALRHQFLHQTIVPLITDEARQAIARHRDAGAICAVVTATNCFVVAPIVRELAIPYLVATVAEIDADGRFSGQARVPAAFREGKIERVQLWLESQGWYWGGFAQTWFYSDSHNDLPLLNKVDRPVAINPDPPLLAYAQAHGWPTASWRRAA